MFDFKFFRLPTLEMVPSGVFISHYSFILVLHMRELSPEKCELVNIWKYCRGGNSSGNLNFFFVYSVAGLTDRLNVYALNVVTLMQAQQKLWKQLSITGSSKSP